MQVSWLVLQNFKATNHNGNENNNVWLLNKQNNPLVFSSEMEYNCIIPIIIIIIRLKCFPLQLPSMHYMPVNFPRFMSKYSNPHTMDGATRNILYIQVKALQFFLNNNFPCKSNSQEARFIMNSVRV